MLKSKLQRNLSRKHCSSAMEKRSLCKSFYHKKKYKMGSRIMLRMTYAAPQTTPNFSSLLGRFLIQFGFKFTTLYLQLDRNVKLIWGVYVYVYIWLKNGNFVDCMVVVPYVNLQ